VLYSVDKTIKVWDLNTLQCIMTLKQHTGTVTSLFMLGQMSDIVFLGWDHTIGTLTIGPQGLLFSGHKSGNLRVWSLAAGTKV